MLKQFNTTCWLVKVMASVFVVTLLTQTTAFGQRVRDRGPYDRMSLELQTGMDIPVFQLSKEPSNNMETGLTVPNFQAGVRYMLNDWLGVRPNYGYHRFRSKEGDKLSIHRFGVDGVVNFARYFPPGSFYRPRVFNVLGHAGVSLAIGKIPGVSGRDGQGIVRVGVTPQYRLSRRFVAFLDVSAHGTAEQNIGFDSQSLDTSGDLVNPTGVFITTSVGIQIYFGRYAKHMDWK